MPLHREGEQMDPQKLLLQQEPRHPGDLLWSISARDRRTAQPTRPSAFFEFRTQSNSVADAEYRRHSTATVTATKPCLGKPRFLARRANVGCSLTGSLPSCAIGAQRQKGSRPFEGATSLGHFDNLASASGRPH
jgi:hypothetical protein